MARLGGPFLFYHMWFPCDWFPYDSPSSCIVDSIIKFDLQSLDCIIKRGLEDKTVFLSLAFKLKTVLSKKGSRARLCFNSRPETVLSNLALKSKTVLWEDAFRPKTVWSKGRSRARLCFSFWLSDQRLYYQKGPSTPRQYLWVWLSTLRQYYQKGTSTPRQCTQRGASIPRQCYLRVPSDQRPYCQRGSRVQDRVMIKGPQEFFCRARVWLYGMV